jgi:MFS family permease
MAGLVPLVQKDLQISRTLSGFIGGGFIIGFMITSPMVALYASRDRRIIPRAIGLGQALWILSAGVVAFANSYAVVLMARIVSGAGEAAFCSLAPTLIKDSAPVERQALYLSIYYTAIFVGQALGYIVSGFVAEWPLGQWLFLIEALLMLPLSGVCLFFAHGISSSCKFRDEGSASHEEHTHAREQKSIPGFISHGITFARSVGDTVYPVVRNRIWVLLTMGYACSIFSIGGLAFWGPDYIVSELELNRDTSGFIFGVSTMISGIAGVMAGGAWLDFISRGKTRTERCAACTWLACSCGILAVPPFLFMASCTNIQAFFASAFLSQFVLFMTTTPVNTGIMEAVPDSMRGVALALTTFTIHLFGDLPSSVLVGEVADVYSLHAGVVLLASWSVFTALLWFLSYRAALSECRKKDEPLLGCDESHREETKLGG